MGHDVVKTELLQTLGYGITTEEADRWLVECGLSIPGKERILREKIPALQALLCARLVRACARQDCQAQGQRRALREGKRVILPTAPEHCDICHGSVTHFTVQEMVAACRRVNWRRLCVVGGSPAARERFRAEVGDQLALRLVDGTIACTRRKAATNIAWADHVVAWTATPLDHKVSLLYTAALTCSTANRRSVEDLARHIIEQTRRTDTFKNTE